MKLDLINHDYKYAVEQILLMMFPEEKPEYNETADTASRAVVSLSYGHVYVTAATKIHIDGDTFRGISRVKSELLTGKLVSDRLLGRIIKISFYKAAASATGKKTVWGALTGIRPAKIMTGMLESGTSPKQAKTQFCREYFVTPERAELCLDTALASLSVKRSLKKNDIALYVGIPFCPTRCAYCSFVSHSVEKSMKLISPFLEALFQEIDATSQVVRDLGLSINSVYIGGGTPTTLSAQDLGRLTEKISSSFDLTNILEYTVEAGRPDTITREKLSVLKASGVTRISINPQTMIDRVLSVIGRKHSAQDVLDAMAMARETSFQAINMDVIAGLPTDTPDSFKETLDTIIGLAPENITVHTLSLKKGARLSLEGTTIPSGAEVSEMLDYAATRLRQTGHSPYYLYRQKFMSGGFENIGWCAKGFESLYNICIMEELCTILSLGGGGVTKLVSQKSGKIERIFNAKYPYEYIDNIDKIISSKEKIKNFYITEV